MEIYKSKSIFCKTQTSEKKRMAYLCFGIFLIALVFSFPVFAADPVAIIHDVNGKASGAWQTTPNLSINITANATNLDSWNLSVHNATDIVNSTNETSAKNETSVTLSVPLDGNYTINLTVVNSTGGNSSAIFSLGVDNATPQVTVSSPASNTSQANKTLTIDFTVTETNLNYTNISIYNSTGGIVNSTNISTAGSKEVNLSVALDGVYSVNVTSYDLAGHATSTVNTNLTIDTTDPIIAINLPANDSILTSKIITVNLTVTEENLNNTNLSVFYTNGTLANSTQNASTGNYTVELSVPTDGVYNITATSYDLLGHLATTSNTNISIDSTAPTVNLILNDTSPIRLGNVTFTLDFSEEMNQSVNATVQFNTSAYNVTAVGWINETQWQGWYDFNASTAEGSYIVNITGAKDLNGNTMVPDVSNTFIFDRTAPTVSLTLSDPTPTKAGNVTFTLDFSEDMDQNINATVQIKNASTYNVTAIGWTNSTRWTGYSVFTTSTGDGNYTVNITAAKDLASNTMAQNIANRFILDTVAPQINLTLNSTLVQVNESINVTCTATDNLDDSPNVSYNNASTSAPGVGRINCTVLDNAGNTNTTSRTYIVNDTGIIILNDNVSVNENQTQVIVTANNSNSNITVPGSVTNSTLDLSAITEISEDEVTVTTNGSISVSANTSVGVVEVQIPSNVTVNASTNWTGVINLPKIAASTTVAVTPDSGKTATVSVVVEIGAGNVTLMFDKAIRLLIPGQAGKYAGFYRNGAFTKIATACSNDSQEAGDNLTAGGDCKIDSGLDLVIWTKHFTSFVTYSQANTPSGSTGRTSSGSSSFSSSVGSATVFWTLTKPVENDDFAAGYTTTLAERQRLSFVVGNETHTAGIINLTSNRIVVNVSSTPQQIELYPGDSAKLDVNADSYYDIYIKLNSIDSNRSIASLTIKSVYEKMPSLVEPPAIVPPAEVTTPPAAIPQTCAQGEMKCESGELQQCENGNWQTIELCLNGCATNPYSCIKPKTPDENPPLFQVGLLIILLVLAALAVIVSRGKRKERGLLENKPLSTHKEILHSKVTDLEQRVSKLEKKGENMANVRLVVEEIKQDLSAGLHYIAEGRLEALSRELAFIEAV